MKFDILIPFKDYLETKYTPNTAKKYYQSVKKVMNDINFSDVSEISESQILNSLKKDFKTKNDFSAAKNGLKAFSQMYPAFQLPSEKDFKSLSGRKRNYKKRNFEPVKLDTLKRRVNVVKDVKTKTAMRLVLISGLRVAEVAALKPSNIKIEKNQITVSVVNGKGGKDRAVKCLEDLYTVEQLKRLLLIADPNSALFPSAYKLQKEAQSKNLEMHDLRRAFAKCYLRERKKEVTPYEANGDLMKAMGHVNWNTTKKYLKRRIML